MAENRGFRQSVASYGRVSELVNFSPPFSTYMGQFHFSYFSPKFIESEMKEGLLTHVTFAKRRSIELWK